MSSLVQQLNTGYLNQHLSIDLFFIIKSCLSTLLILESTESIPTAINNSHEHSKTNEYNSFHETSLS